MQREEQTVTVSIPSEIASRIDELRAIDGSSLDSFLRTAIVRYVEDREWQSLTRYGEQLTSERGIAPDDVEDLVDEFRSEGR